MTDTVTHEHAPQIPAGDPGAWLMTQDQHPWEALRAPFPEDQLELKPQPLKRNDEKKGRCGEDAFASADGMHCGGWHARAIHLTYVGHAGITDRLNEVCGEANWSLEPLSYGPDGLPVIRNGQLWVKLTIWGITKIEVGDADGRGGYEEGKVIWSDALKRAAMRFGIGTYLWSKSDKAKALIERTDAEPVQQPAQRSQRSRPAQERPQEDPWAIAPLRPTGKAAIDAAVRADEVSVLSSLWHDVIEDGRAHGPQTVTAKDMPKDELRILGIAGPLEITDVLRRIKAHLEAEGISVRDHVAADAAPVPSSVGSGDAENARDAADTIR